MRIAQIAPLFEAVPPKLYGGTERVVSWLTEELVAMGHDVTLFASGDSITGAKLEPTWPKALRLDPTVLDWVATYYVMMEKVFQQASKFDVLHFHIDYFPSALFRFQPTPFVSTLHGRLDLPELGSAHRMFPEVPLVSISNNQRKPVPDLSWAATVLHGAPEKLLTPIGAPKTGKEEYFAFLGRISPEKGIERAIQVAMACGVKLKVAAKVDRADAEYFKHKIEPLLREAGDKVELIGEINDHQKPAFLSGAKALLFMIDWPEPFGLVMIESMACGCPVIAMRRGSVPEVMDDGLTGFVIDNVEEAIAACKKVHTLDRGAVRRQFEKRWTARRMADDYLGLYQSLIDEKFSRLRAVGD